MSKSNYESILKAWENVIEGLNSCSRWLYVMLKKSPDKFLIPVVLVKYATKNTFPFWLSSNNSVVSISVIDNSFIWQDQIFLPLCIIQKTRTVHHSAHKGYAITVLVWSI